MGGDGPTHAGAFDISFLRCLPGMVLMAPADENETRQMLYTGFGLEGPAAVRYPRGAGPGVPVQEEMRALPVGRAELRRRGRKLAILSFGPMLEYALESAEELDATVVNMRFVKPLDEEMILEMASTHERLVTVEENALAGGAGSGVNESAPRAWRAGAGTQPRPPRPLHRPGLARRHAPRRGDSIPQASSPRCRPSAADRNAGRNHQRRHAFALYSSVNQRSVLALVGCEP